MSDIQPITRKVMVIDFRPAAVPSEWNRSEDLIPQYIGKMKQLSGGVLLYQVVNQVKEIKYPVLQGGLQYTDASWPPSVKDKSKAYLDAKGNYLMADYERILLDYNLVQMVQSGQVDEVWMFGGPCFGFYESRMVGRRAFWCNGPAIEKDCTRFVIMGFNYERGVKEMVHDYGHRSESILAKRFGSEAFLGKIYSSKPVPAPANEYEKFLLEYGTVHHKPGGEEYSQDEFAWLTALKSEWWPPTIDPNLVQTATSGTENVDQRPWWMQLLSRILSLFSSKKG